MKEQLLLLILGLCLTNGIYSATIVDFCKANPTHKSVKTINMVYDQAQPRFFLMSLWRLIRGQVKFMPDDFKRHFLLCAAKDIGAELGWDKKKIDEEIEALFSELKRIQNQ